ncbi:thioesterase domain-containing protein [Hartmannibacter diazotrophicus]|nr:thioesterase domain-containing protein [Hartmannibacter diazotrophicus]
MQVEMLAKIFAELFELDSVSPDDDYFELGGDSIIAETLMLEIEEKFGVTLSMSVLVEASTPRTLIPVIDQAAAKRTTPLMNTARAKGQGTPLFCIHGMLGHSIFPRQLAPILKADSPIYGIRARGVEVGEIPLTSVEEMAATYVGLIKEKLGPNDPCFLLGHCGGSSIAYEMAHQLKAEGRPVAGVIMIDPEFDYRAHLLTDSSIVSSLKRIKSSVNAAKLNQEMEKMGELGGKEDRHEIVNRAMSLAISRYKPKTLDCPTLFLYCPERKEVLLNPKRGYQTLLPKGTFIEVGCPHEQLFTEKVDDLAQSIGDFMTGLESGEGTERKSRSA